MDMLESDEVDELARVFWQPTTASQLLYAAGVDYPDQPHFAAFDTSREFWAAINVRLGQGLLADGRRRILRQALTGYPANDTFQRGAARLVAAQVPVPAGPPSSASSGPPSPVSSTTAAAAAAPISPAPISPAPGSTASGSAASAATVAAVSRAPVVFLSYAHEPPEHIDQVYELYKVLRHNGVDAVIDLAAAGERQDWTLWMTQQLHRADFVVVAASAAYKRRGEGPEDPADGRGLQPETALIRDLISEDHGSWIRRVVPVVLPGRSPKELPLWVGTYSRSYFPITEITSAGCEQLVRLLTNQPDVIEEPLGAIPYLPPRGVTPAAGGGARDAAVASSQTGSSSRPASTAPVPVPPVPGSRAPSPRTSASVTDRSKEGSRDFLVSAADDGAGWGAWIAWRLKAQGHTVRFQLWDVVKGMNVVAELNKAVQESTETIAVLTPGYLNSSRAKGWEHAWEQAWHDDPSGEKRNLIPVRVVDFTPDGLFGPISYIDLVGLRQEVAGQVFDEKLRASLQGHNRPETQPPFPGVG